MCNNSQQAKSGISGKRMPLHMIKQWHISILQRALKFQSCLVTEKKERQILNSSRNEHD